MAEESTEQLEMENENAGAFFSPAALIMLSLAALADLGELVINLIPVVGQIVSILIDIMAVVIIGGWMWFRSGQITTSQKTQQRIAKFAKWAKRLKWLRPLLIILEFIPIVGALPLWILAVYFELKNS